MWHEEDGIMGEESVTGTISVVGFVSKTTSRMELEGKDEQVNLNQKQNQ